MERKSAVSLWTNSGTEECGFSSVLEPRRSADYGGDGRIEKKRREKKRKEKKGKDKNRKEQKRKEKKGNQGKESVLQLIMLQWIRSLCTYL